ncbi:MAG: Nif3-like dinuclear metal center hexameric protein [Bacteroidales bacterium]|nr:Nif3-like dinuclear metal center hexameric protein [Bacteroidales bacterium]MBN2819432.1 Nif3-like dinuclear metal center hexameric protein [Bacteroidales bacterium]
MKAFEIIQILESFAPTAFQEDYDNSGLVIGSPDADVSGVLCTIDVTMEVLDEAISKKLNMIVSHHPVIFQGINKLNGKNTVEEIVIKAIKNDILLYAGHTNFDSVINGVNNKIAGKIGLENCKVLSPLKNKLLKLVTFVPETHAEQVRQAIFDAGAGNIGNYESCSYNIEGTGTFKGNEVTNPFVGEKGRLHFEKEIRIETVLPAIIKSRVINALLKSHPYEEVAYDLYAITNELKTAGAGLIGELPNVLETEELLKLLKEKFKAEGIRYAGNRKKPIKKIALCGGSGSFLINQAKMQNAHAFITGDIKYHQFFDADNKLIIIDIGHFESEQFTKDIFYELLTKNLPKFAVHLSEVNSNPVKYFK